MFHHVSPNTTSRHHVVSWQSGGRLTPHPPRPPSPAPVREAYGLWVLFGLYSDNLIFVSGSSEDIHLNYQDEWTGRVIKGNGQLLL